MIVVAIFCGLAGGFGAVFFRELIKIFIRIFYGNSEQVVSLALSHPWYWRLLAPAIGGILVGPLVYFFAKEAKGHGVPEVMEAVLLKGGTIRPRVVAIKSLASAICIASGGSVGREGPIVQIGSALGSTIGQLFKVPSRQLRTIVGCGAAAGIAATFNAPIAGALFAVEIILGDFRVPQFSPIVISSVVATVVSRHFLGDFPAFTVPKYQLVSPLELPLYLIIGVIAGFISVAFINTLALSEDFFEKIKIPEYTKASLGGLIVGIIGIWLPHVFGVGYETINNALTGNLSLWLLCILIFAKLIATSITIGSGGSGGVFAPSLFLGAMTGGFLGHIIHLSFPNITATSGAYALVTMGAVVAGATHAPITAIIMIFELTNDYTIIPPLMAACVVSSVVASLIKQDSIYTLKLTRRGLNLFSHEEANVLNLIKVKEVINKSILKLDLNSKIDIAFNKLLENPYRLVFVTQKDNTLCGYLSLSLLKKYILKTKDISSLPLKDIIKPIKHLVVPEDKLELVIRIFAIEKNKEIPVVNNLKEKRLLGSILEKDVLKLLGQKESNRDLTGCIASSFELLKRLREIEVSDDYIISQEIPPKSFIGKSLKELQVRVRYGIEIIMIKKKNDKLLVPYSDYKIEKGDIFLVIGDKSNIKKFSLLD